MFLYEYLFLQVEFKEIIQNIFEESLAALSDQTSKVDTRLYNDSLVVRLGTIYPKHNLCVTVIENNYLPGECSPVAITNKVHLLDLIAFQERINNRYANTKPAFSK